MDEIESLEHLRAFIFSEESLGKVNEDTANEIIRVIDSIQLSPKREEKCINCKYYEKIEIELTGDLNEEIRTACWEECNHPSINEALIWNAKEIGCTEFESKTE